jgi:hypothetical protein
LGGGGRGSVALYPDIRIIYDLLICGSNISKQNKKGQTASDIVKAHNKNDYKSEPLMFFLQLYICITNKNEIHKITPTFKSIFSLEDTEGRWTLLNFHLYIICLLIFYRKLPTLNTDVSVKNLVTTYLSSCNKTNKQFLQAEVVLRNNLEGVDQLYDLSPNLFADDHFYLEDEILDKIQATNIIHFCYRFRLQTMHFKTISFESFEIAKSFFVHLRNTVSQGLQITKIKFDKIEFKLDQLIQVADLLEILDFNTYTNLPVTFRSLIELILDKVNQLFSGNDERAINQVLGKLDGIINTDQYNRWLITSIDNNNVQSLKILLSNNGRYHFNVKWQVLFDKAQSKANPELLLVLWRYSKPDKFAIISHIVKSLDLFFPRHQKDIKATLANLACFIQLALFDSDDLEEITRTLNLDEFIKTRFPHVLTTTLKPAMESGRLGKDVVETLRCFKVGDFTTYEFLVNYFRSVIKAHMESWRNFLPKVDKFIATRANDSNENDLKGLPSPVILSSTVTPIPRTSMSQAAAINKFPTDILKNLLDALKDYNVTNLIEAIAEGREVKLVTWINDAFLKYPVSDLRYKFLSANLENLLFSYIERQS